MTLDRAPEENNNRAEMTWVLVIHLDGLPVLRQSPIQKIIAS